MQEHKGVIIGLVLLVVVAVIGLVAVDSAKQTTKTNSAGTGSTSSPAKTTPVNDNEKASPAEAATTTTSVDIKDYMFEPMDIKVKVGDTVTWTNQDSVHHNVVSDTKSADAPNGPLLAKGETYKFTFKKAGTYKYHCDPHPYMKATVTVTE